MTQRDKLLSDEEIWEEIARVSEELYGQYLEVNELNLSSAVPDVFEQPEVDRDWDMPIGIKVTGEPHGAELVRSA